MSKVFMTPVAEAIPFEAATFSSENVQDGIIEAKNDAIQLPRFAVAAVHNSTLSNGQLVGVTNWVNVPLIIPVKSQIAEITFYQDGGSSRDGRYRFYRNTETAPNLFFTWLLNNTTSSVAVSTNVGGSDFTSPEFQIGDLLRIYYDDTGSNHQDVAIFVYLQAVE